MSDSRAKSDSAVDLCHRSHVRSWTARPRLRSFATSLAADEELRAKAIEELVRLSTDPGFGLDRHALLEVRRTAWRA